MSSRIHRFRALAVACALVAAGCGDSDSASEAANTTVDAPTTIAPGTASPTSASATTAPPATAAPTTTGAVTTVVATEPEVLTFTFVDETRSTAAYADVAELPERTIETTVYLPGTTEAAPLVLFAHGAAGLPERFSELALVWAEAGFVVALPKFPLSNADDMRQTVDDPILQAGDLTFVTDELIASEATPGPLNGRIDFDNIGVGGLSLGSVTTYVHAFAECCADPRLDAVMGLAGLYAVGENARQLDLPLFVAHGDNDVVLGYEGGRAAYETDGGERWMLTAFGGTHAAPFQNDDTVYDDSFRAASTAFWELTLMGDESARARILEAAEADITDIEERTE